MMLALAAWKWWVCPAIVVIGVGWGILRTAAGMMSDSGDDNPWAGIRFCVVCIIIALCLLLAP